MPQVIPIDPAFVRQRFRITLGDRRFGVRVYWREELGRWFFDLETRNGDPILVGRVIAPGEWLTRGLVDERRPNGQIRVWDTSGTYEPPSFDELGARVLLLWVPRSEIDAALDELTG